MSRGQQVYKFKACHMVVFVRKYRQVREGRDLGAEGIQVGRCWTGRTHQAGPCLLQERINTPGPKPLAGLNPERHQVDSLEKAKHASRQVS